MSLVALAVAAALLALERAVYVVIARAPDAFRALCARPAVARHGDPIAIVEKLFYAFKALQLAVFGAWCYVHGGGSLIPVHRNPLVFGLAAVLVVAGQILNVTVFYRLGRTGVFFGDRLGYGMRRCRKFPFSVLSHPQYVATLLTIWGFFLAARFPHGDWYALPVLETAYYAAGAWLEGAAVRTLGDGVAFATGRLTVAVIRRFATGVIEPHRSCDTGLIRPRNRQEGRTEDPVGK